RSQTAERAVRWAANLASSHGAQLLLFQVLPAAGADGNAAGVSEETPGDADEELRRLAAELAGARGRARVGVGADPAQAILGGGAALPCRARRAGPDLRQGRPDPLHASGPAPALLPGGTLLLAGAGHAPE